MPKVAIALGSNVGDRLAGLRSAVSALGELGDVEAISRLYETDPVGGPVQERFLNAVVVLETELTALELLSETQAIEERHGRTREVRWGPRTLDLDLVAHDADPITSPTLEIPHPRAAERAFVVAPLVDVWPDARLGPGLTAAGAMESLRDGGVLAFAGDWMRERPTLGPRGPLLVGIQVALLLVTGVLLVVFRSPAPPAWSRIAGGVSMGAATLVGTWALGLLGSRMRLGPEPRSDAVLVDTGPYRLVRHPIYGSIVVGLAGLAILLAAWPALAGVAAVASLYAVKARYEERVLGVGLPGYRDYLRRVGRRFIPYLW